MHVSRQDVFTAWLLAALHHVMGVSACAGPFAFDALGLSASADDSMGIAIGNGIKNHPHIVCQVASMTAACLVGTLLHLPCIKILSAHEAGSALSADDHRMLQYVKHGNAKASLGFLAHAKMLG